jgi:hypothetical protein
MDKQPFDIVYTWVDDRCPGFVEERAKFGQTRHDLDPCRTRDNLDLLKYSLRSIERFAPWRGKIYIVTCSPQIPAWLNRNHPDIRMVYHEEIMPKELLPSFNAFAIESFLQKIPSLTNRFVHFNDDMLLLRPTSRELFETEDGRLKLYFSNRLPRASARIKPSMFPFSAGQINCSRALDRVLGKRRHLDQAHHPRIIDGMQMEETIATWPEEFARTRAARFRGHDTILPHMMLANYMVANGRAIAVGKRETERLMRYVGLENHTIYNRWHLYWTKRFEPTFLALNDNFGPSPRPAAEQVARRFLTEMFPAQSAFET